MAETRLPARAGRAGAVIVALLGLSGSAHAAADATTLQLQALTQETPSGCVSNPELDVRVEAEVKQLTGRALRRSPAAPMNPTLTPAEPFQVFGGYIEPLDDGWWRARLWLKDAGKVQVAVRDMYYQTLNKLSAELPQDAAALILMPDWSRTASARPQFCQAPAQSPPYPEDACDAFLPPPSCGVPFDCTQSDQAPRCATGPTCGIAGRPPCTPPPDPCRAREWQFRTGIAALVVGGVVVGVGGLFQFASADARTPVSTMGASPFDGMPAAITAYAAGGALLGTGTALLAYWGRYAHTAACKKGK